MCWGVTAAFAASVILPLSACFTGRKSRRRKDGELRDEDTDTSKSKRVAEKSAVNSKVLRAAARCKRCAVTNYKRAPEKRDLLHVFFKSYCAVLLKVPVTHTAKAIIRRSI